MVADPFSTETFEITQQWIKKMLAWVNETYPYFCYFNPNGLDYPHGAFHHTLYAGKKAVPLEQITLLPNEKPKIGIIGYDQKNRYENLESKNPAWVDCPDSIFFSPEITISIHEKSATITGPEPNFIWSAIADLNQKINQSKRKVEIYPSHTSQEYEKVFNNIKEHILQGDIYEMNFCMGYHGKLSHLNPIELYFSLCQYSPMPFSALFKAKELVLLTASPERFIKKTGNQLLTQPIKGSTRRGDNDEEDRLLKEMLANSEKEKSENLMIVDLMRNDLSKVAQVGEVQVMELFGIYSFQQITQMISTISCTLKAGKSFEDVIANTFPMGSMTGVPKIKCMELIDQYENFKRSWFSGTLGYIQPNGDFDFCVIIRSLIVDCSRKNFFFGVGSAITFDSNARDEYQECLLKAEGLIKALKN
ncbi:MAG: anthranilate synthase component I family protein [Cyclobacteriaceae bacterium]